MLGSRYDHEPIARKNRHGERSGFFLRFAVAFESIELFCHSPLQAMRMLYVMNESTAKCLGELVRL
jgi:hypothetical protein